MNRTQATTAIANAIMSNVPTVIMPGDSREWVSISKTRKAFMDWNNRFFAELDRALQLVAVEIEASAKRKFGRSFFAHSMQCGCGQRVMRKRLFRERQRERYDRLGTRVGDVGWRNLSW